MTANSDSLAQLFAPDGPLARAIPGYRPRPQQAEMAALIDEAIRENGVLVAEAGTGTGKTYAYLVPALKAGGKVIVSTGTKTLQDQLFKRDLPTVRDALKLPVSIALLKGRANYVCPYHLERNAAEGRFLTAEDAAQLRTIARFAQITQSGDKAECAAVPEDAAAWQAATSTRDNCLGQDCPKIKECFVMQARRNAMEADVVVVNHHLFFADVMLRDVGMGELLPACNTVIFDEAHQLPETATLFFGDSVSTGQLLDLARDIRSETLAGAPDCRALIDHGRALDKAARDLRLSLAIDNARLAYAQLRDEPAFNSALQALEDQLQASAEVLATQAERSEGLANCLRRTSELIDTLARWRAGDMQTEALPEPEGEVPTTRGPQLIRWAEVYTQSLVLHATPLQIGAIFRRQLESPPRAWIFTSATLAVGKDFSHYCNEMGLSWLDKPPRTAIWGSPFDYGQQAMLYAPPGMPDPNAPNYVEAVAARAWPLIRAAGGGAFVLCTSLRAMREIHQRLAERMAAEGLKLPLLLQGEGSRSELLARFRQLGNAVLVASQSFWEGVDVPGDALSLVIIDKLPFAPPDDPVLAARIEHIRNAGHNPFMVYQLPRTVITLKQGAGRLIRTERDRGVLAICDPRMIDKPYGRRVWQSLPPMRRSRVEAEAVAFLQALAAERGRCATGV